MDIKERLIRLLGGPGRESREMVETPEDMPEVASQPVAPCVEIGEKIGACYGYDASVKAQRPISAQGQPLPWYTYPAIEYLSQWDCRGLNVFEYSSGYGSLWWADKGANQYSVEHDPAWHAQMASLATHLKYLGLKENREEYANAIDAFKISWDLIIIDGVWRIRCAEAALRAVNSQTLLLLDNSDWYRDVAEILRSAGYFQVDFSGFGPINSYAWTTSLFFPFKSAMQPKIGMPVPICGVKTGKNPEYW